MGRSKKKPDFDGQRIMEELFKAISTSYNSPAVDEAVDGHKKMELVAEEFQMSRLKVRKILITTGDYVTVDTRRAEKLRCSGLKTSEIAMAMNIASCTVASLLPYEKTVYKLDEVSTAAERVRVFRERKAAIEKLKEESSIALWRAIILFQDYPFMTSGRGEKPGVKFKYKVTASPSAAGRQYEGQTVDGYGNELMIEGKDRSISRSSVDLAFEIAKTEQVTGPKQLKIYGASYVFAIFRRFGLV